MKKTNMTMTTCANTIVDSNMDKLVADKVAKKTIGKFGVGDTVIDSILEYGMKDMHKTGRNWFIFDMPVELIHIDSDYQREINDRTVRAIIRNYNPNRVDVKLVNFRVDKTGGQFWILDGQHTLTVEKDLGHKTLMCKVFIGLSKKEEAELFAKQNEFRRQIGSVNQFRAEVVAGIEPAVSIKELCNKYGITIKPTNGSLVANNISSIRKCYKIVNKHGIEALDFTLQLIIELKWNEVYNGFSEKVLGIAEAYPYCKGNKKNYVKLMATLKALGDPNEMIKMAEQKFKTSTKSTYTCVTEFVNSIFEN